MRYCIYRIIGNDLPPRTPEGNTLRNLKFILENEAPFMDCEKRFLFNRVYDKQLLGEMVALVSAHGCTVDGLTFMRSEYERANHFSWKRDYCIPINQARNQAIAHGMRDGFEYVLPLDGNCFIRLDGWENFDNIARANPVDAYFIMPMWRLEAYQQALDAVAYSPQIRETYRWGDQEVVGITEPQVVFTARSDVRFEEKFTYGNCDKVSLLWRLGIAGVWDRWNSDAKMKARPSKWWRRVKMAGCVCRLPSGNPDADSSNKARSDAREEGLRKLVERIDNDRCSIAT